MPSNAIVHLPITKINELDRVSATDALAVEEPLEIRLEYGMRDDRQMQNISVTMRTPGNDAELALGFLFTEGIIRGKEDARSIDHCFIACAENKENVILIKVSEDAQPKLPDTQRNFYTTSSCGVCGKGSIGAIRTVSAYTVSSLVDIFIHSPVLSRLPSILNKHQAVFADTGGLHASALFSADGELLMVREDVGRHNALDKLIGAALNQNLLPLEKHILVLSGRASFELVQKAAMAGIKLIAAVGAPSSLAVQLAEEFNITLVGFLRDQRFNIYSGAYRILEPEYENTH